MLVLCLESYTGQHFAIWLPLELKSLIELPGFKFTKLK